MLRRMQRLLWRPAPATEQDIAGPAVAARGADRGREAKRPRHTVTGVGVKQQPADAHRWSCSNVITGMAGLLFGTTSMPPAPSSDPPCAATRGHARRLAVARNGALGGDHVRRRRPTPRCRREDHPTARRARPRTSSRGRSPRTAGAAPPGACSRSRRAHTAAARRSSATRCRSTSTRRSDAYPTIRSLDAAPRRWRPSSVTPARVAQGRFLDQLDHLPVGDEIVLWSVVFAKKWRAIVNSPRSRPAAWLGDPGVVDPLVGNQTYSRLDLRAAAITESLEPPHGSQAIPQD